MNRKGKWVIFGGAVLVGFLALYMHVTANPPRRLFQKRPIVFVEPPAMEERAPEEPVGANAAQNDPGKDAVIANVKAFTDAFNKRNVRACLKFFADDCVLTEHDGSITKGHKELEEELTDTFKAEPNARISVSVESLQVVTPDVIIEEGKTTYYPDGKTLTAETDYTATHVKRGGRWVMTRVLSFNRVIVHPYHELRELEWLVGDWIDESPDSIVESSYRWDKDKTYLLNDFSIRVSGQKVLTGTQRIGRDPLTKQVKAWVFDSQGGYAESLWSFVDNSWVIKAKGVRSDGKVVTVTNQLTKIDQHRFRFDSADRIAGEERQPNLSVIAVRRPPAAKR